MMLVLGGGNGVDYLCGSFNGCIFRHAGIEEEGCLFSNGPSHYDHNGFSLLLFCLLDPARLPLSLCDRDFCKRQAIIF